MPRRQKLLLALVASILVAYLADMAYRRLYVQPSLRAQQNGQTLRKRLHEDKLKVRQEQLKLKQLEDLQQRSLPSDLDLAVSSYRSWLLQLIEQSGLQRTSVDSSPPLRQGNLYNRLDFNIHSGGTLQQVSEFLQAFYASGYLHKIRSMSLNPTANGGVDASVTIETLVLPTAKYTDRLATLETGPAAAATAEEYRVITRRNLFAGGDPIASDVMLTAITYDSQERPQAWISVRSTGQTHIMSTGESLTVQGLDLRVTQIEPDYATIDLDGQTRRLTIGMTLANSLGETAEMTSPASR